MDIATDQAGIRNPVSTRVIVFLKWSKQLFQFEFEVSSPTNAAGTAGSEDLANYTGRSFKDAVYALTKVPVARQKIVVIKSKSSTIRWWTGILKDDYQFSSALLEVDDAAGATKRTVELTATLMGTAEVLSKSQKKTIFLEDLTAAQIETRACRELLYSMEHVAAMIPALQVPPMDRQQENSADSVDDTDHAVAMSSDVEEIRAYDRLVHGLSQPKIDDLLRLQQTPRHQQPKRVSPRAMPTPPRLLGQTVMTMGLELQRAYVNDLAVLDEDGTLLSGLDNGHIQMWKHCHRIGDIVHQSAGGFGGFGAFSGVDSIIALENPQISSPASFATAGKGCIRIWDKNGEHLLGRPSPLPHASPTGLVQIPMAAAKNASFESNVLCLAARFRIARPPSRRPRLVPQDSAGRGRIAEIESTETFINEKLTRLSESVQILFADTGNVRAYESNSNNNDSGNSNNDENTTNTSGNANPVLRTTFLKSPSPVMALASWENGDATILAVGDEQGGIMFWKIGRAPPSSQGGNAPRLSYKKLKYLAITSIENPSESRSAVVCIKYAKLTKQLFISTRETIPTRLSDSPSASDTLRDVPITCFPLKPAQAVHCIDVDAILNNNNNVDPLIYTLDGHKDIVHCILPLPNGDIVTAGGKMDATTQVWSRSQLRDAAARTGDKSCIGDDMTVFTDNIGVQHTSPPSILRQAATTNLCKDAGYIFAAALLVDFKQTSPVHAMNRKRLTNIPFAIAVARYNVVKIVL